MIVILKRLFYLLLGGLSAVAVSPSAPKPDGFSFDPATGVSNRLITPNGDNRNDFVVFTFSNPRDSSVSGKVYDLRNHLVSDMAAGPVVNSLMWDGKSNGRAVAGGIYVYVIQAESTVQTGSLVVVK